MERDEFPRSIIRTLANRTGNRCSRPECRATTSGPSDEPEAAVNIGVAAHITAAAPGGPRYDATLSPEQRSASENAIWLCQTCAHLIDVDPRRFGVQLLRGWKSAAEIRAKNELGSAAGAAFQDFADRFVKQWQGSQQIEHPLEGGLAYEAVRQRLEAAIHGRCEIVLKTDQVLLVVIASSRTTFADSFDAVRKLLLLVEAYVPNTGIVEIALIENDLWAGTDGGGCPIEWLLLVGAELMPLLHGNAAEQTSFWNSLSYIHFSSKRSATPEAKQHSVGEALSLVHHEQIRGVEPSDRTLVDTNAVVRLWDGRARPVALNAMRISRSPHRSVKGFVSLASFEVIVEGEFPYASKGTNIDLWYCSEETCICTFSGKIDYIEIKRTGTQTHLAIEARDQGALFVDFPVHVERQTQDLGALAVMLSPAPIRVISGGSTIHAAIRSESLWKVLSILAMVFDHQFESRRDGFSFLPVAFRNQELIRKAVALGPDDISDLSVRHGQRVKRRSD